ncbi:WD repeat-containing protein 75-like [Lingula anatina]|uniref:WD repeat-containing protein 75-like n=1 Tax=Lingula anatina TaxID=7574 RepID=A0A1S3HUH7_LINAN|nr:WD repeat-containing protein 75-like [Lingula anatina]|eukprot:XP_013389673.1 WD repeat-containing protein 75-like [Lingula anatina]
MEDKMSAPTAHEGERSSNTVVVSRGGTSLVEFRPLFSQDAKCLFCCAGHTIKVYSTVSGECMRELRGHTDTVTGVKQHPKNRLQILSSSLDQSIIQWDYSDGVALKTYQLNFPIHVLLVSDSSESPAYYAVRKSSSKSFELVQFHLPRQASDKVLHLRTVLERVRKEERCLALGVHGEYIAAVQGRTLIVHSFKKKLTKHHIVDVDQYLKLSCVACHPTEYCVATGASNGKILLWWNFLSSSNVVKTVNHWHSLPVGGLCFTAEGSYFLSGGHECVLVKWQYNSHHKDFRPRLGAPIDHVICSHDNTLYATCHSDNVIQLINPGFKVVQLYQGLTQAHLPHHKHQPAPVGLLVDPRTKALVTNGKPGHLQFYSLHSDRHLYNLDIVQQNYVSPDNLQRPLVHTELEKAAFDDGGDWLATVQRREDGETAEEIVLKFWQFMKESQMFVLNTTVDLPHSDVIHTLKFRSHGNGSRTPLCLTTSRDGKFKIWTLVEDSDIYRTSSCWNCESVGYYKEQPACAADFSEDGSLLAVGFGHTLTLWDPDTNALKTTLTCGDEGDEIKHIAFGRQLCCHLLVCTTNNKLLVWNLLSCSLLWSVGLKAEVLVADPLSEHMAVVSDGQDSSAGWELYVFKPSDAQPLYHHGNLTSSAVIGGIFIPNEHKKDQRNLELNEELSWQRESKLYIFNRKQELLSIETESDEKADITKEQSQVHQSVPQTPFSLLLSRNRKRAALSSTALPLEARRSQGGAEGLQELLRTPAHVLPPVNSLCGTFIKTLLLGKGKKTRVQEEDDSDSDDQSGDISDQSESDSESAMDVSEQTNEMFVHKTRSQDKMESADSEKIWRTEEVIDENILEKLSGEKVHWVSNLFNK